MDAPPPAPGPTRRLTGYLLLAALTAAVLAAGMRLGPADLSAPFEYDLDALLILPMVKSAVETGTHWRTDRLGAPGVQELYDFPVIDHLHFAALWSLARVVGETVVAFNLYYLLTYPLTAVAAAAVLRYFGLSAPAAAAGGLLYAFLPYHYLRGERHYFLAAYYMVPVSLVPALDVCRGRWAFFSGGPGRVWPALLIALATSAAGAYYAFFACAFTAAAGLYGWAAYRTWKAAASAGLVVTVVVAGGLIQHAPAIVSQARHGQHPGPHRRHAVEAEFHGLKFVHLLLPVADHQARPLARIAAAYDCPGRYLQAENKDASLGLVGAAGLVGLLAALGRPGSRSWPVGPLAALSGFGLLLGTVGGLGAVYAEFVSPQVRAYNRVSVFLAFLALFAVVWVIDRVLVGRPGGVRWLAFAAVTAFGLWDQCARPWFRPDAGAAREAVAAAFRADAAFFRQIEASLPGGAVFNLPYCRYPETPAVEQMGGYEQVRGFLHTQTVRWSYGAMRGREADLWQREVAASPPAEMVRRLAVRGFDAVLLDRRGYTTTAADELLAGLLAVAGSDAPRLTHPDGEQILLDLRPYRDRLRRELGSEFDALRRRDEEQVRVLWLKGFTDWGLPGRESEFRWCEAAGEVAFVNPSGRPRVLELRMVFRTPWDEAADLQICGDVWADRRPIYQDSPEYVRTVTVPPGRHVVRFRCRPPAGCGRPPGQDRDYAFSVIQFQATERP